MQAKHPPNFSCAVVGAGLVGSLVAGFLARRGFHVNVFEYREDPRLGAGANGRSINLALSTRGRCALRALGLEEKLINEMAIPMKGRLIHRSDGSTYAIPYDPTGEQCIYSITRKDLNELILADSSEHNVSFNFNHKVLQVDIDKMEITIERSNGETFIHYADMIIGADGAHSVVRRCMMKKPRFDFSQTYIEHGYIELNILPEMFDKLTPEHLHIWPRGTFMMIALPNNNKTWTVTLFMPFEQFDKLKTPSEILNFFEENFADALAFIGHINLIRDFLNSSPSPLVSIKCNPYSLGNVLLVGDAAHAMVPFYGQGMNAGFEDCLLLDEILASNEVNRHEDIGKIFTKFTNIRYKDGHAICDLAMYNYREMRHLVNQRWFLVQKHLDDFIYKHAPAGRWTPLYIAVAFTRLRYQDCLKISSKQKMIVHIFLAVTILGIVLMLFFIINLLF